MALLPLFQPNSIPEDKFLRADGVIRPYANTLEPGMWSDGARADVGTAVFAEQTQVTDVQITGTFNSTGTWRLTVIPILTQHGAAAADSMAPAYVEFEADGDAAAAVIDGLIAAVTTSATVTTTAHAAAWARLRSYVSAGDGADTDKIRLTAVAPGMTFTVEVTGPADGDSYALTDITSVVSTQIGVGLYVAIDRTKGTNGYETGTHIPYIKPITSSTPIADIIGPVYFGSNTEPVEKGFTIRRYKPGNVPFVLYGHPYAYGEKAIASPDSPVYIRHTDAAASVGFLAGMVTDAAGAAAGATANLWTGTPTAANDTLFQVQIQVENDNGVVISETIAYLSDGASNDTEICDGLRTNLATKLNLADLITAGGTDTLTLTGPADGRAVTVTNVGPGVIAFVETDAEVSTHKLFPRDKFMRASSRMGAVQVDVPSNV